MTLLRDTCKDYKPKIAKAVLLQIKLLMCNGKLSRVILVKYSGELAAIAIFVGSYCKVMTTAGNVLPQR